MKKNYKISVAILLLPMSVMAQSRNDAGLQGNAGATSGFFEANAPVNFPTNAEGWWHLLDVRHSNSQNNYAMQFSGSFFDQHLFFRKTNDIASRPWSKVLLETDGNVGIGVANPSANLHVQNMTEGADIDLFKLKVSYNGALSKRRGISWEDPSNIVTGRIDTRYDGTVTKMVFGSLYNQGYTSNDIMTISGDGNVGIGTTKPDSKLAVNGKIRAHEIKVELNGWSDFVFAKDYQLLTLQETEKHIKEKGHLPGIPSAADVQANGVDLGEMNAKLLQKIEELTLHLIEMKKENDSQRNAIEDRDKRFQTAIDDLKFKIETSPSQKNRWKK